jgi:hypothetical protein
LRSCIVQYDLNKNKEWNNKIYNWDIHY